MIEDPQDLARLYEELGQSLLKPPAGEPDAEREYTRLFLSPQGAPCPPWQSVYTAPEGEKPRLMGLSHHSALEWYRRFGFEPATENEPADHLGLLLLFYAHLLAADAKETDLERFEREHLGWVPAFAARLKEHARHPRFIELAGQLTEHL